MTVTPTTSLDGHRVCYIETTGRVTGRPHEVEMWYAADSDGRIFALSGGRGRSDWVKNLIVNPQVRVRIGGTYYAGVAAVAENTEHDKITRQLLAAKYQGWSPGKSLSNWAKTSLPVVIQLDLSSDG